MTVDEHAVTQLLKGKRDALWGRRPSKNIPLSSLLRCLLINMLCAACSLAPSLPTATVTPALTMTPVTSINREKAIEAADRYCRSMDMVLVGEAHNLRAKLLTLAEADRQTRVNGNTTNYSQPMDTLVWLVQMDGLLQLEGGPVPIMTSAVGELVTMTPPEPSPGTCSVILDAQSGALISLRG